MGSVQSFGEDINGWEFEYTSGLTYTGINNTARQIRNLIKILEDTLKELNTAKPRRFCRYQDVDESGQYCIAKLDKKEICKCPYTTYNASLCTNYRSEC